MEDSDSLGDLELDAPPKLSFDELRAQLLREPKMITKNKELFKILFHYCKDSKKHARIIRFLFWPIIMSLVQEPKNNKISLFGLRAFNQLLTCEGSLEAVIGAGKASRLQGNDTISRIIKYCQYQQTKEDGTELNEKEKAELQNENIKMLNEFIAKRQNPIHILVKKILDTNSFQIMQEVSKAIRNLSQAKVVIHTLQENDDLIKIIHGKFLDADPFSQENILETVSFACKYEQYRTKFANNEKFIEILLSQVQSISLKVTYFTIKICRQLSKDKQSIEKLQGQNLRLTEKLIIAFKWLDQKVSNDQISLNPPNDPSSKGDSSKISGVDDISKNKISINIASDNGNLGAEQKSEIYSLVFREISKCFQYILKYYETHKKLLDQAQNSDKVKNHSIETDIIDTIVKLGKQTRDQKTSLNAATCLAHITEVLHCNPMVASPDAIDFMIDMLKDAKNLKHYRQGCRYFANLSFYKDFRDQLIEKDIGTFLLKAIDGQLDEDTIKHSAIALANLSSHKDFMRSNTKSNAGGENLQSSKAEKWKIKPLIHLLDSAQEHKINLIQSACITLCNMASKPQLHWHFIHEPEISTIKNCLANPIDKEKGNELVRFMIKLVCNLTKNSEILGHLSKKGFLEILFDLLNHEKEKEIFGNVVTAISYLSLQKDCQEKIIKNKIVPRILEPLTQIHEVDQKMIIIALTSMLFNGIDIQREFIKHGGLGKLLFFMQQKDKIFQQLACKCFSLLSENQQNLQEILDQECLNTIIISCLRTKDIDLETLKEITKIFINLILWRKISKDTFETTCCLCDIGLMIDDQDMNILAIFCLNALSENEESHEYIRNSGVNFSINTLEKNPAHTAMASGGHHDDEQINAGDVKQDQVNGDMGYNSQSIFNRINYLLEYHEQKIDKRQEQLDKQALIVTLITSFYLNLARNEANVQFLLKLQLFRKLNSLMQSNLQNNNIDSTALCYTNTIFSKLLKNPQSLGFCVEEDGYKLFIEILRGQQQNKHLFLETLDSIKLFLSKREYLKRFKSIPECFKLDPEYQDLNVSFLQVLAILSFEKENHEQLKSKQFLDKLEDGKIFHMIQTQFDQLIEQKKREKSKGTRNANRSQSPIKSARFGGGTGDDEGRRSRNRDRSQDNMAQNRNDMVGTGAVGGNMSRAVAQRGPGRSKNVNRRNRVRENQDKNRSEELALAVSIILANLSCDEEFLKILLGYDDWKEIEVNPNEGQMQMATSLAPAGGIVGKSDMDGKDEEEGAEDTNFKAIFQKKMSAQKSELKKAQNPGQLESHESKYANIGSYANFDDEQLRTVPEVDRITRLFNLLSHDNIYISEQISILLANVSNSPYFRHIFVTDRCMKSLLKILRDQNNDQVARVSQLAALIVVLNLTSMNDIIVGMENMKFMQTLQDIIKDENLPNVNKSIALLAISNIQTVSKKVMTQISAQTKDFAFYVLLNWEKIREDGESIEVVKNLVYASLILFYNLILKKVGTPETINQLINVITDHILVFDDNQIINVVLELITLFTRKKETSDYIFQKQLILNYVFDKLKQKNQETLRLAALALSRLAARLDESNSDLFIKNLKEFKEFNTVVENINSQHHKINEEHNLMKQRIADEELQRQQHAGSPGAAAVKKAAPNQAQQKLQQTALEASEAASKNRSKVRNTQIDCILRYFLNFLENITSFKKIRDELDCSRMFGNMVDLYTDDIIVYSKISLISIIFNLNFNLQQPKNLTKDFLTRLYKTYKDELNEDEKTKRKIITIVVSASALEANHKAIIKSNFYTQFKGNINDFYAQLVDADEEVELFGLVNIVLNQNYMHLIYQDLKKIHKIALKNNKIEFKTKVDLFLECSKFLAKLSASEDDDQVMAIQGGVMSAQAPGGNGPGADDNLSQGSPGKKSTGYKFTLDMEKDKSEMIDCCLKALLFSLIKIIGLLDTSNFSMFKYFLIAILDCSKNLKNHLIYLIKIENLIEFLKRVLTQDFTFNMKEFDDQVLNFSLRIIVCEIFFNLKQEKYFFKLDNIAEAIQLLIKFSQRVIVMNIEKKMFLISNTLRLMSQMITQIHTMPEAYERVLKTNSIEFVKDALTLSKDLQPCINIDALFCLTNMMNIKELATHKQLLCPETVNNSMVIYFAYNHQVELDECIITFLYTISKYPQYQVYMKDKSKVLYLLMERQFEQKYETTTDTSRQKIFSLFHNMTENEDICQQLNAKQFINLTNKMLQQTNINKYSADHIHELALKSIINMCKNTSETFEEANLKDFLSNICKMYPKFKNLSKQYALRLITILTKKWQQQKIQDFMREIIDIMSQFIENCESVIELKLVIMNLEKVASSKQLMKCLADLSDSCKLLIRNIHHFIAKNIMKKDYHSSIEQLFRFCKKLSKQPKAQEYLVNEAIHEICLRYISENLNFTKSQKDDQALKQILTTIQNIMKMIKNIFDGNISPEQKQDIFVKVTQREQIITDSDRLLSDYKDYENKDELAIIIVNIIICYNSISNKLDSERVKSWIQTFSERLIAASKKDFNKEEQARSWYMEKYVLIIELLVTKNLEKIDREMTLQLLKIYDIKDTKYFTNTIWYKLMKILAHLQNIQEITHKNYLENIMQFILLAYEKAQENLCFFYFMKIVLLIVKKFDNNVLMKSYKQYNHIITTCIQFLKNNCGVKNDPLILEILLYIIDMLNFLMKFHQLHEKLNDNDVVSHLIQMLDIHDNAFIMKSLSSILLESSKITAFYPDLLSDQSLNIFLNKMLNYQGEPDSLSNMFDCLRNIIQQTKTPIKYLLATSILKITEDSSIQWQVIQENNIYCLLKVLNYNIRFLNDEEEDMKEAENKGGTSVGAENSNMANIAIKTTSEKIPTPELLHELQQKALKYSIMAITNILIQTNKDLIFYRKLSILSILQENCKFEVDPQMNLRLLYLLNLSLSKQQMMARRPTSKDLNNVQNEGEEKDKNPAGANQQKNNEINQQNKEIQSQATISLVNFLLENIFKFKSIIQIKDQSFYVEIPKINLLDITVGHQNVEENGTPSDNQSTTFFFEDESYELNKISGIRLSLCLSLRILYKLSVQKKKIACQAIIDNKMSQDLFLFFFPYVEYGDRSGLKQIKQVVKIIQNCAEFIQLHSAILDRESITSLIKLAEVAIDDDFSEIDLKYRNNPQKMLKYRSASSGGKGGVLVDLEQLGYSQGNETQRKIIVPILKIFISLCSTPQFHWHLSKYNALDLLNRIGKDDDYIQDVAKEVCEKVIDHSHEGQINNPLGSTGAVGGTLNSQNAGGSLANNDASITVDYDVQLEINTICSEANLQVVKNCVINMEKMLIQKKLKLDKFNDGQLSKLVQFFEKILTTHSQHQAAQNPSLEEETNSQLRRIIIKSILVILNFVYSKKYLKDIIAGYSQPNLGDGSNSDIFPGKNQIKASQYCVMEEESTLKIFKNQLFSVIREAQQVPNSQNGGGRRISAAATAGGPTPAAKTGGLSSHFSPNGGQQIADINQGFTTYADFRDINEEVIYLFCSYAMSMNFSVDSLCGYILPIGQQILNHCIYSIKKSQESGGASSPKAENSQSFDAGHGITSTSITTICSISSINAALESIVIILRNPERNIDIMKKFDLAGFINSIIQVIKIFEMKASQDLAVKEQFENKIQNLSLNLELITKLMYFSPQLLMQSSINLIHNMLNYHRYIKTGIFAIYCVALMIQEDQQACIGNLIPVFNDDSIMNALFNAIKDVDKKYKELKNIKSKNTNQNNKDMLEAYEQQNKTNLAQGNKQLKMESEAMKEFNEAITIRKSCLQILIVIVEFLSNAMIKNGHIVIQAKTKEVQEQSNTPLKLAQKPAGIQQVIPTNISAAQHEKLTHLIYNKYDLLDLIYKQVIMRIPEAQADKEKNKTNISTKSVMPSLSRDQAQGIVTGGVMNNNYLPSSEEIKLGARAFASMPFSILKKKNPILNVESQFLEQIFSITGYFKALLKIIDNGYGNKPTQHTPTLMSNKALKSQEEAQIKQERVVAKQATYFALYALLEFIIQVPLSHGGESEVTQENHNNEAQETSASLKLEKITYQQIMSCLIKTGLLQKVIQLPNTIDINSTEEEPIIRLCMKLLISIIFKGQSSVSAFKFSSKIIPQPIQSVFSQTGISEEAEKMQIMSQFQQMIQKIHNFEIAQIHQDSYVQYLHLLSQITVHTQDMTQDPSGETLNFTSNSQFLIKNIHQFSEKCIQEDQRKKLLNSQENGQKNMIYQFFFINYLLSVCIVDVVQQACKSPSSTTQQEEAKSNSKKQKVEGERSISQKIFIILIKLLEALSDKELNAKIDGVITNRLTVFKKAEEHNQSVQNELDGIAPSSTAKKSKKPQDSGDMSSNSATMTITKMILFNMDKLLQVSKKVQDQYIGQKQSNSKKDHQEVITHKMQIIHIDEDQLDLLVKLLSFNEQNGEIVNKIYEILQNFVEVSKSSSQAIQNINVIDMSKGLLQICIKHSSIYQCENAFKFLEKLVMISDKYQNKDDIKFSLTKIMPATMKGEVKEQEAE